jgi:dTDP-4-amino-4,6-dideoxygalactose transaminase
MIDFNKPYLTGNEVRYIKDAVELRKLSGNGDYTKKCQSFFEERYKFKKCLLTTSCTDALEMASILIDIKPGDEIIAPSYTFVSTINPFVLRSAKIIFADSCTENPNVDIAFIESLITPATRAIVVVHYAGIAVDMDKIMKIANRHNLLVIEDAAHCIDSFYKNKPLGSIGHLGTFSFHETKNIISGEGGMLVINDPRFIDRAEIIWEKGTNRAAFFRGEVNKYGWVDVGSSFLPSEITSAFLYAQLEKLDKIQGKRKKIWNIYDRGLKKLAKRGKIKRPVIPDYATNNAHMYYIICGNLDERSELITYLKANDIYTVFHYLSLHKSPFYLNKYEGKDLPNTDMYSDCLLRLPMYYELKLSEAKYVCEKINAFYESKILIQG